MKIDVILTSCGRWDLLSQTIQSFLEHFDFPFDNFYIYEDSGQAIPPIFKTTFPMIKWIEPMKKTGQIVAIDALYKLVKNEFIFFLEDDWQFTSGGFVHPSIDILESNPKVCQVWLREPNDRNGHPAVGQILQTERKTQYQMLATRFHGYWSGFSFNPGLRRVSDYQKIGPYSNLTTFNPRHPLRSEVAIGREYLKHGFKAATLLRGYVKHIGAGRSIKP